MNWIASAQLSKKNNKILNKIFIQGVIKSFGRFYCYYSVILNYNRSPALTSPNHESFKIVIT